MKVKTDKKDKTEKKDKKEKHDKKDKTEKAQKKDKSEKKQKKELASLQKTHVWKRERSKSQDGQLRRRKSKWDADDGVDAVGDAIDAIVAESPPDQSGLMPAQRPEHYLVEFEDKDSIPKLAEDEIPERTVVVEELPLNVKGKDLVEYFNGAVLAVTGNTVVHANKPEAPIFASVVSEVDVDNRNYKIAELRFRTPEGANVCMKLSGIEYQGRVITIKRPANFVMPEDGADPSTKTELQDTSLDKLIGAKANCAIFNLPDTMSEQVVKDLLGQFGKIKMLKLTMDTATGKIKGYGIFEYVDPDNTDLAIHALNGFVCGSNVIRAQDMRTDKQKQAVGPPPTATALPSSVSQKIAKNPTVAMQVKTGCDFGAKPTTVVQLLNAVYRTELSDDQEYQDIFEEMRTEASAYGAVTQIVIPRPASDGSLTPGVGKVFVAFRNAIAARKFQNEANGRKFDERTVCAAFYPVDKFDNGEYSMMIA